MPLLTAQIDRFNRDGFLPMDNVLTPLELLALHRAGHRLRLRRDKYQRRLPERPRAERAIRRVPDGNTGPRRRLLPTAQQRSRCLPTKHRNPEPEC